MNVYFYEPFDNDEVILTPFIIIWKRW
jgi:hypothetical protein